MSRRADSFSLEHIDPRNGVLVCGLCNELNEVLAQHSWNSAKQNRFVPYRVCEYPAPVNPGDIGEFLIQGEWVVCEFAVKGGQWWAEANNVGCGSTQKHTPESVMKMRKPKTLSHRQNMRKPKSETHRKNMAGERNNQYGKKGELSPNFGREHSDLHNKRISKSKTGTRRFTNLTTGKRVYRHENPGEGWVEGWVTIEG